MSKLPDKNKELRWRRLVARQKRSRQSIRAFCQREGLTESAFHFWRHELAQRDEAVSRSTASHVAAAPAAPRCSLAGPGATLLPLALVPPAVRAPLELVLPSGATLRIQADAPPELLARLLTALGCAERSPC